MLMPLLLTQAPKEGSQQSPITASNPRSAALQRAAAAQVRAASNGANTGISSPTVTTLPASLAQATGINTTLACHRLFDLLVVHTCLGGQSRLPVLLPMLQDNWEASHICKTY